MEFLFRIVFLIIFVSAFTISATYRRKARQSGDVIARQEEGKAILILRVTVALPLLIALLLYIVSPQALAWSRFALPLWLRWLAVGSGLLTVPFIFLVFRNIGRNISETILTKSDYELVTYGPYRRIRHPLYASSLLMLFSLSLIASNWFLLLYSSVGYIAFRWLVIPTEEQLIQVFGDIYEEYQLRTGALFPRLF